MIKTKGYFAGVVPIYFYEDKDVVFLEGINWFWERILTLLFNIQIASGVMEEVDYQQYI